MKMLVTLINHFVEYVNNIYIFFKYFTIKKNKNIQENTIHENIYLFLHDISKQWKHNDIQDIDLLCDILNIYYKNKCNYNDNIEPTVKKVGGSLDVALATDPQVSNKETYLKYYMLGWYMYHHIEKNSQEH
jgi:hypothetical protein